MNVAKVTSAINTCFHWGKNRACIVLTLDPQQKWKETTSDSDTRFSKYQYRSLLATEANASVINQYATPLKPNTKGNKSVIAANEKMKSLGFMGHAMLQMDVLRNTTLRYLTVYEGISTPIWYFVDDSKRVLQTAQEMKAEIDYQIERQDITSFQIRNKNQSLFKHLSTISFDGNAKEWMFKGTLALSLKRYKSTNPPNFCSVCGRGKWFAALVQCCNCDSLIHVNAACSKLIVSKELQSKVKNFACDECSQSKQELLDLPIFEEKKELKKKES
eukprot:703915_1